MLPLVIMDWIYGFKEVEEFPGSGGPVVIAVFPVVVILSTCCLSWSLEI